MGLGVHQKLLLDDINHRCVEIASQGQLVTYGPGDKEVQLPNASGDAIAGMLMIDVVNRGVPGNLPAIGEDTGETLLPRNLNANQTYVSGVVRLAVQGEIETDQLDAGDTYAAGDILLSDGAGGITLDGLGVATRQVVGRALQAEDGDGFLRLYLDVHGLSTGTP